MQTTGVTFDDCVEILRGWQRQPVVVVLEPDHSVMEGRLEEIDSAGMDGALFVVSRTGIAVALFRDAFVEGTRPGPDTLRVTQGRVDIFVTRQGERAPARAEDATAEA